MRFDPHLNPSDYEDATFEDIRTIPDFYDELYPSAERPMDGKQSATLQNSKKKRKTVRKSEKNM